MLSYTVERYFKQVIRDKEYKDCLLCNHFWDVKQCSSCREGKYKEKHTKYNFYRQPSFRHDLTRLPFPYIKINCNQCHSTEYGFQSKVSITSMPLSRMHCTALSTGEIISTSAPPHVQYGLCDGSTSPKSMYNFIQLGHLGM